MVLDGLFKKKEEKEAVAGDLELQRLQLERDEFELRSNFYKKIIEKYAAMINEYEEKTVPELKNLINRNDPAVQALKKNFLAELSVEKIKRGTSPQFSHAEDFLFIMDKVFKYCQSLKHIHANLSVSFWQSMAEIAELQAADPFDRAILLCSILTAFDGKAHVRVLELENNVIHPIVIAEFEGKRFVLDPSQPDSLATTYSGELLESVLQEFQFDGNKYLKSDYEFSEEEYLEF
ncbi:MAG: hypothetical protein ABIG96_02945 [Candidatus Micrarchaeota archaeon]